MSAIKEHFHDQIIAASRDNVVDESNAPEAEKLYRKIGNWYVCIDKAKQQVFLVRDEAVLNNNGSAVEIRMLTGEIQVEYMFTYSYMHISAEDFKEKYLETLDKINYSIE